MSADAPLARMDSLLTAMSNASGQEQWAMFFGIVQNRDVRQDRVAAIAADIADDPALPECAGFTGTGQRCTACRTHRRLHG